MQDLIIREGAGFDNLGLCRTGDGEEFGQYVSDRAGGIFGEMGQNLIFLSPRKAVAN